MKVKNLRANATEINKTPHKIRYIFVIKMKDDSPYDTIGVTTTYKTLSENIKLNIGSVAVVDLKTNIVSYLRLSELEYFLDEWRDNYFDPDWDIPYQFFK